MKQRFYASIALLLVAVLTAALLCGCHSKPENSSSKPENFSDETSSVGSVPTTESDSNSMPAITPDESSGDTTPNGTNGSAAGTEKSTVTSDQTEPPATSANATPSTAPQTETPPKEHTPASFTACSINTSQLGTFRYGEYAADRISARRLGKRR